MSQITLLICDHCDCRDRVDDSSVARNKIEEILIVVTCKDPFPAYRSGIHLCKNCRSTLDSSITNCITQIPCKVVERA